MPILQASPSPPTKTSSNMFTKTRSSASFRLGWSPFRASYPGYKTGSGRPPREDDSSNLRIIHPTHLKLFNTIIHMPQVFRILLTLASSTGAAARSENAGPRRSNRRPAREFPALTVPAFAREQEAPPLSLLTSGDITLLRVQRPWKGSSRVPDASCSRGRGGRRPPSSTTSGRKSNLYGYESETLFWGKLETSTLLRIALLLAFSAAAR